MRAHKVDNSQAGIVAALEKVGAIVWPTTECGRGAPDLVVGYRGRTFLLELKSARGKQSAVQVNWAHKWKGYPVSVVRSAEEALIAIGAV